MAKITTQQAEYLYRSFKILQSFLIGDGIQKWADTIDNIIAEADAMQPTRFIVDSRWIWLDLDEKYRHLKANDGKAICGKELGIANSTDTLILHCMECMHRESLTK